MFGGRYMPGRRIVRADKEPHGPWKREFSLFLTKIRVQDLARHGRRVPDVRGELHDEAGKETKRQSNKEEGRLRWERGAL